MGGKAGQMGGKGTEHGFCFMGRKEDELHNIMLAGPSVVGGSCDLCLSEGDMTDRVTAAVAIFAGSVLSLSLWCGYLLSERGARAAVIDPLVHTP